ncbi:MAG: hypothetical protein ABWZ38_03445 [Candidatus Binatia bacterium]|jgi:hypothetical protein
MKLVFFVGLLLLAGCAPPPSPYPAGPYDSRSAPPSNESRSTNTLNQDASECERKAALSAGAGSRAEAFNNCMKARGRTPN